MNEERKKERNEYVREITNLLKKCTDEEILDFVFHLLKKKVVNK